ncbi:DUF4198 domain-containing protein [Shewanella baltica]|uniref:DUF4198 domain-containing protein n=1 Tax=Shewanella baltica TaxID=62322 RepID=UPI00217D4BF7|nr:DUF4198 domain-containing protein [Shewanella baltica]MCS6133586.1 DUF4198 domain-containing protein [Shewanella baltica]MCS6205996.1 DUF4198 domain-containing protein [Shewanella baltica]
MKLRLIALLSTLCISPLASSHDRWILPSHFNVSAESQEAVWITSDVSASNQVFMMDKPFSASDVRVLLPDGESSSPSSSYTGGRKSVFDVQLLQDGTYKFEKEVTPRYFSRYKVKGKEGFVRSRLDKKATAAVMPKGASELEGSLNVSRVETYVTRNKPTDKVLAPKGEYLELVPVTHPADIVENEPATLQFVYDGKPVAGVSVAIMKDGSLYRNKPEEIALTSDKDGKVAMTLPAAGRYLLHASIERPNADTSLADKTVSEIFLTFEAGLE